MCSSSLKGLRQVAALLASVFSLSGFAAPPTDTPALPLDPLGTLEWQEDRQLTSEEQSAIVERNRAELQELAEHLPRRMAELKQRAMTPGMVEQARIDAEAVALHQESLTLDRVDAERRIKRLAKSVRELEARAQWLENPARGQAEATLRAFDLVQTRHHLAEQRRALDAEQLRRDHLNKRLELAGLRRSLAQTWRAAVEDAYYAQLEQQHVATRAQRERALQREQQIYFSRAAQLREQLIREGEQLTEEERLLLETAIKMAEARARLVHHDIRLAGIEMDLERLDLLARRSEADPPLLQDALREIDGLIAELRATDQLFIQALPLGERQRKLIAPGGKGAAEARRALAALLQDATRRQQQVAEQQVLAARLKARLEARYESTLRHDLLARSELPGTREGWSELLGSFAATPKAILYQVQLSVVAAAWALVEAPPWRWVGLVLALGLLLWLMRWVKHASQRGIRAASAGKVRTFVGTVSVAVLRMIQRNVLWLGLTLALLCVVWISQVPQPGRGIIATLVLVGVIIKAVFTFVSQVLAAADVRTEHIPPRLFTRLRWSVLAGGILGAGVLLIHLSGLPEATADAMDRAFMLYLLLVFPTLLGLREFVLGLLVQRYAERLWFQTFRVVSLLLMFSLVGIGLIGVVGYLNLAWMVGWYLGIFLLGLVAWQAARGLLGDGVILLKNLAVKHTNYGLLWTQDIIAPVHRILEAALFIGALLILSKVYGIQGGTALASTVSQALEEPLVSLGGVDISSYRIMVTLFFALLVIALGRWIRGVTYRWALYRVHDLGVRHSLSVFIQYVVVLIGLLVVLRGTGLSLTTMAVFAGAVGVAVGLGMQAIASNFLGGLLLLIERPLKAGDIISVGTHEGEVTRVGMRSVSLRTWDNYEVIIPNADVVTNAFTNWTHNDSVVRTVLWIGVSYDADPDVARETLERVVTSHPGVLAEPAPMVLLWQFIDSSIQFRVQYYIDVSKDSRLAMRSAINRGMWYALKEVDILIPFPQQDVHIKEWPDSNGLEFNRTRLPQSSTECERPAGLDQRSAKTAS
ncbi:MAG: mechanosensitive ion channel domain-containing protein [Gammaproteobacteria bacterium]